MSNQPMRINTRDELLELHERLKVRADWHEPDNQDVTAAVVGSSFDNAMGTELPGDPSWRAEGPIEMQVLLFQGATVVGAVNLATLFAIATTGGA